MAKVNETNASILKLWGLWSWHTDSLFHPRGLTFLLPPKNHVSERIC